MQIGERVYKYLEEKGMSQAEFVSKTGISQSTVSDWKRKGNNPSADKIMIICEVLGVSPYQLLTGSEGKSNSRKQVDYVAVDKDSKEYMLIETYQELSDNAREELEEFMENLKGTNEK
ncbi:MULTISPECIES: helix-turn-helix domain-containing protein [Clostridia]|jgi:transcriptional regulator with XRE-family HTH domain|uniref:helix-turn-helix domain-containing protein n=1 Tax=Clostridia TaxID=186801 RepID=UPI000E5D96C4|nr:helix-turn-helix transcriptional regulator [Eubacterium sp. AF22-9]MED9971432.1 helix-turn-helix transcriptional regulator [Lachnospira sp.]RGS33174.1 XRE family transcriptional regulator [Eubacterium sp. AF22-9]HAS07071.1 XRE family transcriptional regulator [Eubacterium sp.]HCO36415.1 XRE family transcriptional regulator [Eubacterium sp.]